MGKYDALREFLDSRSEPALKLSFGEIERILGEPLPASARTYPAWWENESHGTHVHARAWLDAGYRTQQLNLGAGAVEFVRAGPGTGGRDRRA